MAALALVAAPASAQDGGDGTTAIAEDVAIPAPPPPPGADDLPLEMLEALPPAAPEANDGDEAAEPPVSGDVVDSPAATAGQQDDLAASQPGKITVYIEPSQTTYVDARFPDRQFSGASQLLVATFRPPEGLFPVWALAKFSNMGRIPPNSTIYGARIALYQTGADAPIRIQPYTLNSAWSPAITYYGARGLSMSPYGGAPTVGTSRGWVYFDVSGLLNNWMRNPGSNNGMLFYGSTGGTHSFNNVRNDKEPTLQVDLRCDYYKPTSSITAINSDHRVGDYVPAEFAVNWSGQDKAQNGCPASGIDRYHVQYAAGSAGWATLTDTRDTRHVFRRTVADGTRVYFRVYADDKATNREDCCKNQPSVVVDVLPPVVSVAHLPPFSFNSSFPVQWTAPDATSGIATCKLWQQVDGGTWSQPVTLAPAAGSSFVYTVNGAEQGKSYGFRVQCRDRVGNETIKPENAQVTTRVLLYPEAEADNIVPNLIDSRTPVSTSFVVRWFGFSPPELPIQTYEIYYRYQSGAWQLWKSFPAGTTTSEFKFVDMGMGSGLYEFQALAIDNNGRKTPFNPAKVEGSAVVVLNGEGGAAFMPVGSRKP